MDIDPVIDFNSIDATLEQIKQLQALNNVAGNVGVKILILETEKTYEWDTVPTEPVKYTTMPGLIPLSQWNGWSKDTGSRLDESKRDRDLERLARELTSDDTEAITRAKSDQWHSSVTDQWYENGGENEFNEAGIDEEFDYMYESLEKAQGYDDWVNIVDEKSPTQSRQSSVTVKTSIGVADDDEMVGSEMSDFMCELKDELDTINDEIKSLKNEIRGINERITTNHEEIKQGFGHLNTLIMVLGGWVPPPAGWTQPPQFAALNSSITSSTNKIIKKIDDR